MSPSVEAKFFFTTSKISVIFTNIYNFKMKNWTKKNFLAQLFLFFLKMYFKLYADCYMST